MPQKTVVVSYKVHQMNVESKIENPFIIVQDEEEKSWIFFLTREGTRIGQRNDISFEGCNFEIFAMYIPGITLRFPKVINEISDRIYFCSGEGGRIRYRSLTI